MCDSIGKKNNNCKALKSKGKFQNLPFNSNGALWATPKKLDGLLETGGPI